MLRLVTWNLDGLEDRHLDVRTEAACLALLLRPAPPDVVLLQEVVPRSFLAHLRPHFAHAGYAIVPSQPPEREYFVAAMIRDGSRVKTAWRAPFRGSRMGRELLGVQLAHEGREWLVCTAHLESLKPSREERRAQLATVAAALAAHAGPAVFAGDTNLRDEELPGVPGIDGIVDAAVLAGRPAATWFPRKGASRGMRFDRVLLDARTPWRPAPLRLLGEEPVDEADRMRISDHLGIEVVLDPGPMG